MMELQNLMARYAHLVVESGLHLKKGQPLLIHALLETAPFVRLVVREAYEAGASRVEVVWRDEEPARMDYTYQPLDNWQQVPAWQAALRNDMAKAGGAILTIDAADPEALTGVDPRKPAAWAKAMHRDCKPYYDGMDKGENIWCIIAAPSEKWAARIFPDLPVEEAVATLWQVIGKLMRLDAEDPSAAWEAHRRSFEERKAFLNGAQLDALHFTSASTGTDLTVGLPQGYIWAGGGAELQDGTPFFPNMPTEEIFCSPHRERADGVVHSSLPLCHNGEMVEDFSFTFWDGKVVDYTARVGKEVLARLLETDEGAVRLGECALIPKESPIAGTGLLFYNTLFDENAACHLALGAGFSECLEGGLEMDDDQLKAHGVNCSAVHMDFMFGTPDLSVTGIRKDGTQVPIFRDGSWVI